jgi:hypothetical protein
MEADPDRDLVERCRREDLDALRQLVQRFAADVYAPIARATADPAASDQLAQTVFVHLHRDLPEWDGTALATWVQRHVQAVCPQAESLSATAHVVLPDRFVVRTLTRLASERWRREQRLDLLFNAGLTIAALGTIIAGWRLFGASGLSRVGSSAVRPLQAQLAAAARGFAPSLPGYVAAIVLIAAVLFAWWWAERES